MRNQDEKGNILTSMIVVALTIVVLFIVVNMSGVEAGNDALLLKGLYGKTIPYSSITSAELYETDLPMVIRLNGIGLGFIEIGHYRLRDLGTARLFILKRQKPYLLLRSGGETILIGVGAEKNQALLERIQAGKAAHL
jgi:hypothetical protein